MTPAVSTLHEPYRPAIVRRHLERAPIGPVLERALDTQVAAEGHQVAELREDGVIRELFCGTDKTGPILVLWRERRLRCCIQLSLNSSPLLSSKTNTARPPVGTPSASPGNQREAHRDPSTRPTAGAGNRDRLDVQARRTSALMLEQPPRCRRVYRRRTGDHVTGFTRDCIRALG